ncbi:hypothetical protein KIPB_014814, partial [Kipferlia bialata]
DTLPEAPSVPFECDEGEHATVRNGQVYTQGPSRAELRARERERERAQREEQRERERERARAEARRETHVHIHNRPRPPSFFGSPIIRPTVVRPVVVGSTRRERRELAREQQRLDRYIN